MTPEKNCAHFAGQEHCAECKLPVDQYGNTEDEFKFCSFPDCGCDGARLCMADEPSDAASRGNVEGMWEGKAYEQLRAAMALLAQASREDE